MLFAGISRMDCNDIVDELLKYGYADISDYDYTDILLIQDWFFGQIPKTEYYICKQKKHWNSVKGILEIYKIVSHQENIKLKSILLRWILPPERECNATHENLCKYIWGLMNTWNCMGIKLSDVTSAYCSGFMNTWNCMGIKLQLIRS